MNASKNELIVEKLQEIVENEPQSIKAFVANEALESENVKTFFDDLLNHGCISGMISSLIYYNDTHTFYDTYYSEIEDLRYEYESSMGKPIVIKGDLKNHLAWFAFEQIAYQLAIELKLI